MLLMNEMEGGKLERVEKQINNRPRKRFNYESPIFMFNQKVAFST